MTFNKNLIAKKPKRVIIFGKTGFVAKNVSRELIKKKIRVKSISKSEINLLKNKSVKKISKILKNKDVVLFISANAPVKNEKMFKENIIMMKNFILGLKKKKISHFVYVSSDAVYSDSKKLISEKSKTQPQSLHGLMHLTRENLFKSFIKSPICIVRPTLIYGKEDPHNGYGPNRFFRLAKKKKKIILFGKGEELRDHVSIHDVSKIILNVILFKTSGILNICTGIVVSFYKIAKLTFEASNNKKKIFFSKRIGSMPHGGYRAFNNQLIYTLFPNFKFNLLNKKNIKKIYN